VTKFVCSAVDTHAFDKALMLAASAGGLSVLAASPWTRILFDMMRDWVKRRQTLGDQNENSVSKQLAELRAIQTNQGHQLAALQTKTDMTYDAVKGLVNTLLHK
jgi:hypothetical protein